MRDQSVKSGGNMYLMLAQVHNANGLVLDATHIHRQFLYCYITAPFPLSPTAQGRVPEGEIIHCRVCQRQWGGLSMGPPSLPCLGLPLLPARPFSSAWHSGDSRTEPEANLSLPHSPSKMISLCFVDSQSQGPNEAKWMPVRPKL